jgi:hypothetical protein
MLERKSERIYVPAESTEKLKLSQPRPRQFTASREWPLDQVFDSTDGLASNPADRKRRL